MHKNISVLEIKKGERIYQLLLDQQSPLGEVFDALCEMRGYVAAQIAYHEKLENQKSDVDKPLDPVQEEPIQEA